MDTRTGQIYDEDTLKRFTEGMRLLPEDKPFIKPMRVHPTPVQRATGRVQRNDPCPCGSGRKFKKCCWGRPT